ncbi:hypothetical protein [Oceanobacillus profundus]|uniref:Uncharacterized protein n=1 Tax=Oceanobacillus profundus TaxID=372463 RepID=A0A417YGY8_9BACI|nr:hypothetical protein [Oceanobacillus profundus]RHW32006.1 hypothetical protein D1B32_12280 [Oceanobacillus profundus]
MSIDETYSRTYIAFCGADLMVTINGEIVGELQELNWEEDFFASDEYTINGEALFVTFEYELDLYKLAKEKREFNICIAYAAEYGKKMYYRIYDCLLTKRAGKHAVDDIVINEKYYFKAKRIEKITGEKADFILSK